MASLLLACYLGGGITFSFNRIAEAKIASGDLASAKSWLCRSQALATNQATTHFLLARVARHEGDLASMAQHLKSASQLGFDPNRLRLEEMLSLAQSGRLRDVEKELTSRLAAGNNDAAEICEAYANGLARESRFDEALAILKAWRDDRPHEAVPYYRIARIEEHMQLLTEAKSNYLQAVTKNPHYYPAIYSLARMNLDENNASEAAKGFEMCLAMPNPLAAKVGLGLSLVKLGELDRAQELLEEVQSSDQDLVRASYASVNEPRERNVAACELGKLYQSEGKLEDALRMLNIALQDNQRDLTARYTRALVLKALQRQQEAEADFATVSQTKAAMERVNVLRNKINRDQNDIQSRLELGKLLIEFESERNGVFWLRSALQLGRDSAEVHRALAEYYESRADQSLEYRELAEQHRQTADRLTTPDQPN